MKFFINLIAIFSLLLLTACGNVSETESSWINPKFSITEENREATPSINDSAFTDLGKTR